MKLNNRKDAYVMCHETVLCIQPITIQLITSTTPLGKTRQIALKSGLM